MDSRMERRKARKKRLLMFFIPILVAFLVVLGYGGYLAYKVFSMNEEVFTDAGSKSPRGKNDVNIEEESFSVLFIGVDSRKSTLENSRSDALILATLNPKEETIKMLSIPRDSYVDIPGHGMDKINHAHVYGGAKLTIETVQELFDIPVDHYVELNFDAFIEIINAVGGVEVNVPFDFYVQDSNDNEDAIHLEEGLQTLNGEEALGFVRMRKSDPRQDIGRGDRQKQLLKALMNKLASASSVTKYDDVIESLENNMNWDFTRKDMIDLLQYRNAVNHIESLSLKGQDYWADRYYYKLNQESVDEVSNELQKHLNLEQE